MTLAAGTQQYTLNNLPANKTLWARLYTKVGGVYGTRHREISFST